MRWSWRYTTKDDHENPDDFREGELAILNPHGRVVAIATEADKEDVQYMIRRCNDGTTDETGHEEQG